jgi:hypothetical protein
VQLEGRKTHDGESLVFCETAAALGKTFDISGERELPQLTRNQECRPVETVAKCHPEGAPRDLLLYEGKKKQMLRWSLS